MPKIDVIKSDLEHLLGGSITIDQLEQELESAKAEIDRYESDTGLLRIELNDTNRPDLWSTAGLARHLNHMRGKAPMPYDFYSTQPTEKIIVDPSMKNIRPYILAFIVKNKNVDDTLLKEIIQTQEKLCENYGSHRSSVAIGIYRLKKIHFPVHYKGYAPDKKSFIPLDDTTERTLHEILETHPKGKEYGSIISPHPLYPIVEDAAGNVLSMPPIINSQEIGSVQVGDSDLFVEMTGIWLEQLMLACNIMACDLYDRGFSVQPVSIEYPYATTLGKTITAPRDALTTVSIALSDFSKALGVQPSWDDINTALHKIGVHVNTEHSDQQALLTLPPYRTDYLHPVDAVEDYAIAVGYNRFNPILPQSATIGRLTPLEEFSEKVRIHMIGMGFEEITFNILRSREYIIERQNIGDEPIVEIANPMSANYAALRNRILPSLLEVESKSARAPYPHKLFESGEIIRRDDNADYGSITFVECGSLIAHQKANFSDIHSYLETLLYYLAKPYTLTEQDRPYYIPGRSALITLKSSDKIIGEIGEIHPSTLTNWGIQMPCVYFSITLDLLYAV